jgi:hypothetical protein
MSWQTTYHLSLLQDMIHPMLSQWAINISCDGSLSKTGSDTNFHKTPWLVADELSASNTYVHYR